MRDLGFHINSDVTLITHVAATIRACLSVLRQKRGVHCSLTSDALIVLLRALVISKVDYCCSALVGMSGTHNSHLQSVLNAAARLVFAGRRSVHVTPYSRDLHWPKVRKEYRAVAHQWQTYTFEYRSGRLLHIFSGVQDGFVG